MYIFMGIMAVACVYGGWLAHAKWGSKVGKIMTDVKAP